METYGKILLVAMPVFLLLVLFEKWWGWRKGNDTVNNMDMIASLSSGITNATKDVLGLSVIIISYGWFVKHLAITTVPAGFFTYFIAFMALDFSGYWVHRISHQYNLFWNNHIIHHSSEEFNLACALRQSISSVFKIFAFFLLPAAVLGVPESVIAIVAPLHLFAQFWYHTRHINKMGFLEKIIVTPSHHRVHHAINPEYIDKNYSQIFIFWDRLFGTFQQELDHVPPVYGITRPANTWNPIRINFMHLWLLMQDMWRTKSMKDKLRIWIMPTGWRPADVIEKYPLQKIEDVYHFKKYAPFEGRQPFAWSAFQIVVTLLLISYLFGNIANIGSPAMFVYGGFIFLSVYAYTEFMDGSQYAVYWEIIKSVTGIAIVYFSGSWFGIEQISFVLKYLLLVYFITSPIVTGWLLKARQNSMLHAPAAQ